MTEPPSPPEDHATEPYREPFERRGCSPWKIPPGWWVLWFLLVAAAPFIAFSASREHPIEAAMAGIFLISAALILVGHRSEHPPLLRIFEVVLSGLILTVIGICVAAAVWFVGCAIALNSHH